MGSLKMLKKQTKRKIIEDKIRRRKEQTPSRLSEPMSGHPHRPPRVPFPSARPLQTSQEEISEPSVKNSNSNVLQVDQNHFFDMSSRASSQFEPLIPDFSLSSSDSEDELELHILTKKMILPMKHEFILPRITESKINREIYGSKYFKIMYHNSPKWFAEILCAFYSTYLDIYDQFNRLFPLVSWLFWCYHIVSYLTALRYDGKYMASDFTIHPESCPKKR